MLAQRGATNTFLEVHYAFVNLVCVHVSHVGIVTQQI